MWKMILRKIIQNLHIRNTNKNKTILTNTQTCHIFFISAFPTLLIQFCIQWMLSYVLAKDKSCADPYELQKVKNVLL